jgi:hypothetical protein
MPENPSGPNGDGRASDRTRAYRAGARIARAPLRSPVAGGDHMA